MGTLVRLLRACDESLESLPATGVGVDRSEIRRLLALSEADRAASLKDDAALLDRLDAATRQSQ
jgi:hypothetical protein